jgi:hypothetical protein
VIDLDQSRLHKVAGAILQRVATAQNLGNKPTTFTTIQTIREIDDLT